MICTQLHLDHVSMHFETVCYAVRMYSKHFLNCTFQFHYSGQKQKQQYKVYCSLDFLVDCCDQISAMLWQVYLICPLFFGHSPVEKPMRSPRSNQSMGQCRFSTTATTRTSQTVRHTETQYGRAEAHRRRIVFSSNWYSNACRTGTRGITLLWRTKRMGRLMNWW